MLLELTIFKVGQLFKFSCDMNIALMDPTRGFLTVPPMPGDYEARLARYKGFYTPEVFASIIESAPASQIGEINKAFIEPVDVLGVELEEDCRVLTSALVAVYEHFGAMFPHMGKISTTRDLVPFSDVFLSAHNIQLKRGASTLRIIRQRTRSFRKNQLSVGSGFHLLLSIVVFAAIVNVAISYPYNYMVSFLLPYLLFIPFRRPHNNMYSRKASITDSNDL
jgi:hypothetical protein